MLIQIVLQLILASGYANAFNGGLTISQAQEKVQNQKGSEASDPLSFGIMFGHEFDWWQSTRFAPRIGYIKNTVESDDHYAGKYKIETIYLLYDVIHPLTSDNAIWFRGGIGNFIKRTKGDGGTVTIPNGAGTATAYKPGDTQQSFTSTLNLGLDWNLSGGFSGQFEGYGVTLETFWNEILDSKKRMFTLQLAFVAFF